MPPNLQTNKLGATTFDPSLIMGSLQEYFVACDHDHDGRLGYDGFLQLVKYLGASGNPANRQTPFADVYDRDHKSIDIFDFIAWWME